MRYAARGRRDQVRSRQLRTLYYQTLKVAAGAGIGHRAERIGWDATWIVIDALRKYGTSMTATQLHDYIENLHGFVGINGIMDFSDGSQRGLTEGSVLIVRWDAARKTWIPQ